MKITADFTCLLKAEEQKIMEGTSYGSRNLTQYLFQLEEKDYNLAIAICRDYKKSEMCSELESIKADYLNTDYDNLEERKKFLGRHKCYYLNPLEMPRYLERNLQYRKSWDNKKLVTRFIENTYNNTLEYQVLTGLSDQVEELYSYWIDKHNYFKNREEMEDRFKHLCNIEPNFSATIAAGSAAADKLRSAVVVAT